MFQVTQKQLKHVREMRKESGINSGPAQWQNFEDKKSVSIPTPNPPHPCQIAYVYKVALQLGKKKRGDTISMISSLP